MSIANLAVQQPPQIKIFYYPQNTEVLVQIQYGLEEEGIPFSCEERTEYPTAEKLGFAAAENSILGVGVGIGEDGSVALHYHRLHPNFPLFLLPKSAYTPNLGRTMGSNAARLVKGNPFKPLEETPPSKNELPSSNREQEALIQLVTGMVYQMLQEGKLRELGLKEVRE